MTDQALVPVEQKRVLFYEDEVTAVRLEDGRVFVPVRPLCDLLGVAWTGQNDRINRDPVLSQIASNVRVTRTEPNRVRQISMLCLPLEFLNGWLFGIQARRVKPEVRERLVRYQLECYRVLYEAFQVGGLTTDPMFDDLLQQDTPEANAYKMAQAVLQLARNQLLMRAELEDHTRQLQSHTDRLESIEAQLGNPERQITEGQASQLSQAVKAVAMAMSKQTRRNEYGGVYGELYRRYDITGYKMLPARKFEDAMSWLGEWLSQLNTTDGF